MLRRFRAALAATLPAACLLALLGAAAGACGGETEQTKDGGITGRDGTVAEDGTADDQSTPQPDQGAGDDEFGRACDTKSDPCPTPLVCMTDLTGTSKGFCTKQCTNQGVPCSGSPPGTVAYCIAKDPVSGTLSCAFVCAHPQLGNQKCPAGLQCPEKDNPPGSGQKICGPA